jgi:hypothetical protein
MKLARSDADIFTPDGTDPVRALARTTHLCIGAHQDDIEIMAHDGIAACFGRTDKFFTGVVVTNGAGSPRSGRYAALTDADMIAVRRDEQRRAAALGRYNLQLQLAHPSPEVKTPDHAGLMDDFAAIFNGCAPEVVYLHNPADKHDTHVAVFLRVLKALRAIPRERRPRRVLGCEVWRDLDWLVEADKVALDTSAEPQLAVDLLKVFDSQISGGKRYDLGALGRRAANATFHTSHATDGAGAMTWAMDLTPLVADETLDVQEFVAAHIDRLRSDVVQRIAALS